MRNFLALGAASVLLITSAVTIAGSKDKDIVDTAVGSKSFPTLVSLVKSADLVDTLKSKGPFTVFAPTEDAFKALPKATLDAVTSDKELLKKVLLYHVVPGNVMAKDVVKLNGKTAKTALDKATVNIKVDSHGAVFVNDAKVIKTDIAASNGTIHVINKVLVPAMEEASEAKSSSCGGGD